MPEKSYPCPPGFALAAAGAWNTLPTNTDLVNSLTSFIEYHINESVSYNHV